MTGDDRVRFCDRCRKNVYNLSSLTREQAEALVFARQLATRDEATWSVTATAN